MRKKCWLILPMILILAGALSAGCGSKPQEPQQENANFRKSVMMEKSGSITGMMNGQQ